MVYLFLLLLFFVTSNAQAEFNFDDGVRKPKSMLVAGDSVIDANPTPIDDRVSTTIKDDAHDFMDPEKTAPALPDVDAFTQPDVPTQRPIKKVVKTKPNMQIKRTIADDRIDDSYVQELMKSKYSFTNPIE